MSFADAAIGWERQVLKRLGRNDLTHIQVTLTTDPMGRSNSVIETNAGDFLGDVQPVTALDKQLLEQGEAQVGDSKLYTDNEYNTGLALTINIHDIIVVDGGRWEVVTKMEEHKITDNLNTAKVVHNSFILRLRA